MLFRNLQPFSFLFLVFLFSCGGAQPVPTAASPAPALPSSPAPAPVEDNEFLSAVNALRATGCRCGDGEKMPPAPPLRWNSSLAQAAQIHTEDMARKRHFSHTGTDRSEVGSRARKAGFNWSAIAENIALGQQTTAEVVAGWQSSQSGHCQNMMSKEYTDMGMALADGPGGRYWTLVLGAPL